ncbi:LysR family transcriptional regulator [Pseudomonas sp.]|jgi:DNA-binding transcriptional LysR family regulator|uniref:LysR family transcriptional regulator n=1 Tax=Pseudomonas sp. TaxID=306 RepID=UPI0025E5C1DC|nr:LysR family transcriptional regulator [Pseudomonas sp.]
MDTQHLRTFIEVVRQGSFAGAARRLDMASSQVTRAVAALETDLGTRLMHRTTRKLTLTESGAAYFGRVSTLMDELDAAADDARTSTGEIRGMVRLTASVALGQKLVVPLLEKLHRQHPGLQLELRFSDLVVDLVGQQVDVALRQSPSIDESLVGLQLGPLRFRVCASPNYLTNHGRPEIPADLSHRDCLRIALPGFHSAWSFRRRGVADADVEVVPIGGWLSASSSMSLLASAVDGLGPVLLADWLVEADIRTGRLVDLFPGYEVTSTHFDNAVWLLYASRDHLPRRVRVVVDFLRTELQPLLGAPALCIP